MINYSRGSFFDRYFVTMENENNPELNWNCGECLIKIVGDHLWMDKVDGSASYMCCLDNVQIEIGKIKDSPGHFNYYELHLKTLKDE